MSALTNMLNRAIFGKRPLYSQVTDHSWRDDDRLFGYTPSEFDTFVTALRQALEKEGYPTDEVTNLALGLLFLQEGRGGGKEY